MNNIVIVEDDYDFRVTLSEQLDSNPKYSVLDTYIDFESFFKDLKRGKIDPDILIVDIQLPGMSGIKGIQKLLRLGHDIDIIVLTVFNDEQKLFHAIQAGASSYVLKSDSVMEIEKVIEITQLGGAYISPNIANKIQNFFTPIKKIKNKEKLTDRETEIISLLSRGFKYQDIADKLFISIDTVRYHIKNIYAKLRVNSRDEIQNYLS